MTPNAYSKNPPMIAARPWGDGCWVWVTKDYWSDLLFAADLES